MNAVGRFITTEERGGIAARTPSLPTAGLAAVAVRGQRARGMTPALDIFQVLIRLVAATV